MNRPVHLVGLAPVSDGELVPSAIARAIGARESSGRDVIVAVADTLDGTGALLLLDNLEHLPSAAVHIAGLIDRVPDLQVLATSRAPLRLSTEHVLPLEPLSNDDATTLFVELAAARGVILQDDALASVHEICRRLDGLPLAIELVAARLAVLPPAEILRALGEGLTLEMEGPVDLPERQRTLRAAIDWSYQRLSPSQRDLHGVLAVFADSGSLDDAKAISGAGHTFLYDLEALVGWSLVRSESSDGELRLSMLETVREHALDHVRADGNLEPLRQRHAERFLDFALTSESQLAGPDRVRWQGRLARESDNITAALDWLLATGRAEDALRATNALERFWRAEARLTEARRWLSLGLDLGVGLPVDVRALSLRTSAHMAMGQSDWETAMPLLEEAIALFRECGRQYDEVVSLSYLSFVALRRDAAELAESLAREGLQVAKSLRDDRIIASALMALADVDWFRGDYDQALGRYDEAVALSRTVGDQLLVVDAVYNSGMAAFQAAELDRARQAFEEALDSPGSSTRHRTSQRRSSCSLSSPSSPARQRSARACPRELRPLHGARRRPVVCSVPRRPRRRRVASASTTMRRVSSVPLRPCGETSSSTRLRPPSSIGTRPISRQRLRRLLAVLEAEGAALGRAHSSPRLSPREPRSSVACYRDEEARNGGRRRPNAGRGVRGVRKKQGGRTAGVRNSRPSRSGMRSVRSPTRSRSRSSPVQTISGSRGSRSRTRAAHGAQSRAAGAGSA